MSKKPSERRPAISAWRDCCGLMAVSAVRKKEGGPGILLMLAGPLLVAILLIGG
jgi:hypothetical protein